MTYSIERSKVEHLEIAVEIRKIGFELYPDNGYERIIFTNGCFDILHVGHAKVFERCRQLAGPRGTVVVGINSDESVIRLKGPLRPIVDEVSRATMVIAMRDVDHVVIFEEDTPRPIIEALRPHVIVKGGDYTKDQVVGHDLALVDIVPIIEGFSTTSLLEKLR